jgi:hypothetical protein
MLMPGPRKGRAASRICEQERGLRSYVHLTAFVMINVGM